MVTFCSKKAVRLFTTPEYRKLSFSFPPDIGFFLVFPVLLKVCIILEMVFLGIAYIFDIGLIQSCAISIRQSRILFFFPIENFKARSNSN